MPHASVEPRENDITQILAMLAGRAHPSRDEASQHAQVSRATVAAHHQPPMPQEDMVHTPVGHSQSSEVLAPPEDTTAYLPSAHAASRAQTADVAESRQPASLPAPEVGRTKPEASMDTGGRSVGLQPIQGIADLAATFDHEHAEADASNPLSDPSYNSKHFCTIAQQGALSQFCCNPPLIATGAPRPRR